MISSGVTLVHFSSAAGVANRHMGPLQSHWRAIPYIATASIFHKDNTRLAKWGKKSQCPLQQSRATYPSPKTLPKQDGGWIEMEWREKQTKD